MWTDEDFVRLYRFLDDVMAVLRSDDPKEFLELMQAECAAASAGLARIVDAVGAST